MNFKDISDDFEPINLTFYHPLCDLDVKHLIPDSKDKLLHRPNSEIRVLTYNIFLRPPLIKNNENDWKDQRLEDFCNIIHNYDVICLQEMFGAFNNRKHNMIRAATLAGFFFYVDTTSPSFISKYVVDGGLLILSRFPISAHCYLQHTYGVVVDSLAEKGIIYTKINIKDCYLHIFTTHLQASYFDSEENNFIVSFHTRMTQIKQINFLMRQILKKEYNKYTDKILLLGDFNVDGSRYKYKIPPYGERSRDLIDEEYSEMIKNLNHNNIIALDSFYEYKNIHPITYADVDENNNHKEIILTNKGDLGCRQGLDYIFDCFYDEEINNNNFSKKKLTLDKESLKVETFMLKDLILPKEKNDFKRIYTQLSDHYGLSCKIIYNGKKNNNFYIGNIYDKKEDINLIIEDNNVISDRRNNDSVFNVNYKHDDTFLNINDDREKLI